MTVESDSEIQEWEMYFEKSSVWGIKGLNLLSDLGEISSPLHGVYNTQEAPTCRRIHDRVGCTYSEQKSGCSFNQSCLLARSLMGETPQSLVLPVPHLS